MSVTDIGIEIFVDDSISFIHTSMKSVSIDSFIEIEASFPYRDVQLKKGSISKEIYDISSEELGR